MTSITLTRAIFGMGNAQYEHVHRHNELHIDSMEVDRLRLEQMHGGLMPSTLNQVAMHAGQLTARPQGYVSIEGGYAQRRGIGKLDFVIESNAMHTYEMCVVGYLHGGTSSHEGISDDCRFIPVRCWSTLVTNTHDTHGLPMAKHSIDSSHQFLMGDPNQKNDLKALRPVDVGNEALGFMACQAEGSEMLYTGTIGSDLRNNVLVSKTQNLNPTHYSRELLRLATRAGVDASNTGLMEVALADGLIGASIGEISPTENPFMQAMMFSHSTHSLAGFGGFTIGEIYHTFDNLLDVMNLNFLNPTMFAEDNTLLTSSEYGSAGMHETVASEVAMMTVHLLLQCGLASLQWSATNNPHEFSSLSGDSSGVMFLQGNAMSMLDGDMFVENRVEQFKQLIAENFFAKYSGAYAHLHTIISLEVECHMFGEIVVRVCFNGETDKVREFTNASYYINHTSSSISGSEAGLNAAKNFVNDINDYFK